MQRKASKSVKVVLPALSSKELTLVLEILKLKLAPGHVKAGPPVVSPQYLRKLDKQCLRFARELGNLAFTDKTVWGESAQWGTASVRGVWHVAQSGLLQILKNKRHDPGRCFELVAALEMGKPKIVLQDVEDYLFFLEARMVGNGQHWRFVQCGRAECGKWSLRKRARREIRYCSPECMFLANKERARGRYQRKFAPDYFGTIHKVGKKSTLGRRLGRFAR